MKKITFFLSLLCLICIGATAQSFTPAQDKAYTVKTVNRGWYQSNGTNIIGTDVETSASHFAFIEYYSKTFLYSVTDKKFIGKKSVDSKAYLLDEDLSSVAEITVHESGNTENPFYLTNQDNLYFNMASNKNVLIDNWKTLDPGNMLAIAETIEFSAEDLAEAKTKLNSYFTTLYNNSRNEIPALIQKAQLSTYFTKSNEEIQKLQKALDENVVSSEEGYGQAAINLKKAIDAFKASASINTELPNGKYLLINAERGNAITNPHYLSININKQLTNTACTTRSVWNLTTVDGGYTIQNVMTGDYVQEQTTTSAQFSLGSTPVAFTLTPNDGGNFGAALGREGRYTKLHEAGNGPIVAWETAGASCWFFIPYTEDMASQLATAETNLFNQEKAPYVTSATNLATKLYVSTNENVAAAVSAINNSTFNTLSDNINHFNSVLGTAISKHYYRIQNVKNQTYFSLREGNNSESWCSVGNSSDVNQIWQIVGENGGFKFKNVNTGKYLASIVGGSTSTTSLEEDGAVYSINDKDNFVEIIIGGKPVQCETTGHLNWWYEGGEGNARWTISEATDITVDMNSVNGESWASLYLPFGVQLEDGVEAYIATGQEPNGEPIIYMDPIESIPANTGVVLKGTAESYTLTIDNKIPAISQTNFLGGFNVETTLTEQSYDEDYEEWIPAQMVWVFGCRDNKVGFYLPTNTKDEDNGIVTTTLKANKAYLDLYDIVGQEPLLYFAISFNKGENTGIQNTVAGQNEKDNIFFDLSGRRVQAPVKGIYVTGNGKKIYVK